jgi:hypothetical protein
LRGHVERRLSILCRTWPSISPWNVWDLPLGYYLMFCDDIDEMNKPTSEGRRR